MTGHKKYIQFSGNMVQSPLADKNYPSLQQNLQKEMYPGAAQFSRVKGFRVGSIKYWYLCSHSQQKSLQK